ncbi:MAG TPA: beta-ketoacyl-ACP synthase II [Chloroflexota bacterium]
MDRRVVVTGMGCLTPLGTNVPMTWHGIKCGKSGIGPIERFDPSQLPVRFAGECKSFDPTSVLTSKDARRMDRFQQMAYAASVEARDHARLDITPENADRVGVIIGSGIGGLQTLSDQFRVLFDRGPSRISPFLITMMVVDLAPGLISILIGAKGPNYSTVSACATSAHAIGEAAAIIRRGQADVMLAGGSEAGIVEIGVAGFSSMRALSTRNDDPEHASRPFDAERDGFVMAEGAGTVVLEELEHARNRGATIHAELVGYGLTADASHITDPAPGGEGAARAMAMALDDAEMAPDEIQYLNAHGTSTPIGDRAETAAIKSTFCSHASRLAVSSTKSMTGHLLGAAGAVEGVICIKAMQEGFVPPTINYQYPDPECDLDYVPNAGRPAQLDAVMSNSFGFGGHNVSLIFRSFDA